MDEQTREEMLADERFLLGEIAGRWKKTPRKEEMVAVLVEQLKLVQARRTAGRNALPLPAKSRDCQPEC